MRLMRVTVGLVRPSRGDSRPLGLTLCHGEGERERDREHDRSGLRSCGSDFTKAAATVMRRPSLLSSEFNVTGHLTSSGVFQTGESDCGSAQDHANSGYISTSGLESMHAPD